MPPPEVVLWQALRARQLDGLRFRRQHPMGPFILDFYCPEAKLCVEVDGYVHTLPQQAVRDERREDWLAGQGVRVVRIPAIDVVRRLSDVLDVILGAARGG